MASIKVKFRPSTIEGKKGVIYYQVIQNRIIRQLKTNYHISPSDWDEENFSFKLDETSPNEELLNIDKQVQWDVKRLEAIIRLFEKRHQSYSSEDIIDFFQTRAKELSLFDFMHIQIEKQQQMGRARTAETYTTTLYSISRYLHHEDILMEEITSDLLQDYEDSLHAQGVSQNSSSFYMRILRAVYNRSVDNGIVEQQYPFKDVYTGIDKTVKKAIPMDMIKAIKALDYSNNPHLSFARDMFLFSFYTRGMSFIDMAYLRKDDLQDDTLIYARRKTGHKLFVKWEPCMQEIVDKHPSNPNSPYMLPILKAPFENERNQYKTCLFLVNKNLKIVAAAAGIPIPLTMFVARHSWASIASQKNIPLSIISEGMGHESEQDTMIYLASLDNTLVDKANSQILDDL